ncbi:MAG: hypothetical protein R3E87_27195 [Burkholderiaceae bacterium]
MRGGACCIRDGATSCDGGTSMTVSEGHARRFDDLHIGCFGPGLVWDGDPDVAMLRDYVRRGAGELQLWRSDGAPLGPIDRLLELPDLLGLRLMPGRRLGAADWAVLTQLSQLRWLGCPHPMVGARLDLAAWPALESLQLPWWPALRGLDRVPLRRLDLDRWRSGGQPLPVDPAALQTLLLRRSDVRDLRGLAHLRSLRCLCLYGSRQLQSLDGIEQLAELEELSITGPKNPRLRDLMPLTRCRRLKRLELENCTAVESLPLADLPQLEAVWTRGTPIHDGRLAWLRQCTTLVHTDMESHPHHDLDVSLLPRAPRLLAYRSPPTYEFSPTVVYPYWQLRNMETARVFLYPRWLREQRPDLCLGL